MCSLPSAEADRAAALGAGSLSLDGESFPRCSFPWQASALGAAPRAALAIAALSERRIAKRVTGT